MSYLLVAIMGSSVALQCVAAFMAIRLVRISGGHLAWVLLSAGFILQGVRRAVALTSAWVGSAQGDMAVELIGLLISLLMVCGVCMIRPLFVTMKEDHQQLVEGRRELERTHQELMESELRYRTVADITSDWEFWIAPDGTLKYVSPSCAEISGYSAEEFYSNPLLIERIIHPDDLHRYESHTNHLVDGRPQPLDFRITSRGGETRWISHVCRPVVAPDGSPLGFRASNRDITQRKRIEQVLHEHAVTLEAEIAARQRAQEALAAKTEQLEALNRTLEERVDEAVADVRRKDQLMISQSRHAAMGEMIDYIAHQWKHPLNNLGLLIQGIPYQWQAGTLTPEQLTSDVDKGMELIEYMAQTIDDFRDFFRDDKMKRTFSVRESVARAISLVEASLKDSSITVVVEPGDDVQIQGYRNEFAQALLNLLGNARDALLEQRAAEPEIRVRVFAEPGRAVVAISDNAGGISPEILDRVFDPYFTTKSAGKGSGIGLFMAKIIIEKMGGRLSVRNTEGGAEFTIEV